MDIQAYLNEIRALHASGQSTEHSFRPALSRLFASIDGNVTVINEPKRLTDVGAPDFVFSRNGIAIGWAEAKDIGKDIRKFAANDYSKEQKARYAKGLPNLIYTNGLDFEFIDRGNTTAFVTIADLIPGLPPRPKNFTLLESLLRNFVAATPISINNARQLAEMMAGKAALIKEIMGRALVADMTAQRLTDLTGQYEAFKANLIHDISVADFADIYAETIAYGLFAARLHDTNLETFSRAEALDLLPRSNPFLRALFGCIAGVDLDERIRWVIDELCEMFRAADLHNILKDFGKFTARNDPFLHFYETFLAEYNPAKRKARGVWYTPEPVVNFIVRAVDDVLKTEFGLVDGLADTSKVTIDWDTGQTHSKTGKPVTIRKDVHRVQILDPATGTGTFLAEVIKLVAARVQGIAPGQWSTYVEQDLIPRIHGFELLMASYAMCHMKLDMILTELGYRPSGTPPRLGVYLTNSLEEGERVEQNLFGLSLAMAREANEASNIKRQTPIMCVIGNPPYSGESANKGAWITGLMEAYKQEPGGKQRLQESQTRWLKDDYVKFIRFAENMISKNGEGVLGFITNHGYLDNPTFRGMRWHLMASFDRIYVLDLHGNTKKKEASPDGSADKNVFDIQQGVAIIIAVKRRGDSLKPKALAQIRHGELWGTREDKYAILWNGELNKVIPTMLPHKPPTFPMVQRDYAAESAYMSGFSLVDLLSESSTGILTARDTFTVDISKERLEERLRLIHSKNIEEIRSSFAVGRDSQSWSLAAAIQDALQNGKFRDLLKFTYRPFDERWTLFTGNQGGFHFFPANRASRHMVNLSNIAVCYTRKIEGGRSFADCFVSASPITLHSLSIKEVNSFAPLFLYPQQGDLDQSIRPNFNPRLYARIRAAAGLTDPLIPPDGTDAFRSATGDTRPDEVKVFDYIYGVLHCPAYRETYAEFLKIDFPRVPFPPSPDIFRTISEHGEALRRLHLMEPAAIGATPFPFDGEGDSVVDKPRHEDGKVWINKTQHFSGVSTTAWTFPIGSYQPAQKWLKDRKGRALTWEDVRHYQRIIKILDETDRIMKLIELPLP